MFLQPSDELQLLCETAVAYGMAFPWRLGSFSVAPVAFAAVGAYGTALLTLHGILSFGPALAVVVVGSAIAAAVLAYPLGESSGLIGAILSLAMVIVIGGVAGTLSITGGSQGLYDIPYGDTRLLLLGVIVILMIAMFYLDYSQLGRRLEVASHDADAALSLGVNVPRMRALAQIVGMVVGALAGGLYVHATYALTPDVFGFDTVLTFAAILIVGGAKYGPGPILGAIVIGLWQPLFRSSAYTGEIISGFVMVVVIVVAPEGLAGALRRYLRYHRLPRSLRSTLKTQAGTTSALE